MQNTIIETANEQLRTGIGAAGAVEFETRGERHADLVDVAGEPRTICAFDLELLSALVREQAVAGVVRLLFAVERQARRS